MFGKIALFKMASECKIEVPRLDPASVQRVEPLHVDGAGLVDFAVAFLNAGVAPRVAVREERPEEVSAHLVPRLPSAHQLFVEDAGLVLLGPRALQVERLVGV